MEVEVIDAPEKDQDHEVVDDHLEEDLVVLDVQEHREDHEVLDVHGRQDGQDHRVDVADLHLAARPVLVRLLEKDQASQKQFPPVTRASHCFQHRGGRIRLALCLPSRTLPNPILSIPYNLFHNSTVCSNNLII